MSEFISKQVVGTLEKGKERLGRPARLLFLANRPCGWVLRSEAGTQIWSFLSQSEKWRFQLARAPRLARGVRLLGRFFGLQMARSRVPLEKGCDLSCVLGCLQQWGGGTLGQASKLNQK